MTRRDLENRRIRFPRLNRPGTNWGLRSTHVCVTLAAARSGHACVHDRVFGPLHSLYRSPGRELGACNVSHTRRHDLN